MRIFVIILFLCFAAVVIACGAGGNPTLDDLEGRSMSEERGLTALDYVAPVIEDAVEQSEGLNASSWPKFRKNAFNTGRSATIAGPTLPDKEWQIATGEEIASSAAVDSGGYIYFAARFKLYKVHPNATTTWEFQVSDDIWGSPAIDKNGNIYVGSGGGSLYALTKNGTKIWEYGTGAFIEGCPLIDPEGYIYCGTSNGHVFKFASNGVLQWEIILNPGFSIATTPAMSKDMRSIYFTSADSNVYSVNLDNGGLDWIYDAGNAIYSSPVVDADGYIYFGCDDGHLYKLDSDGEMIFKAYVGGRLRSSPALNSDGNLIFGSEDNKIVMFHKGGQLIWSFETGGAVIASPVVDKLDNIFVGCYDHKLYALNKDGLKLWAYVLDSEIHSSPSLSSDGRLYFGGLNGKFYSIQQASGN